MDLRTANLVPAEAASPEHARALVARDGAALVSGVASAEAAIEFGRELIGRRLISIRPQFEVTKDYQDVEAAKVAAQGPDERGRRRSRVPMEGHQPAHNDGFGFGDFAPDVMFLYCERPCAVGGASFLVDALSLLAMVSSEDPEFGRFAWDTPIDHSMPNYPHGSYAPIARILPGGRVQVRAHPDQAAAPGAEETRDAALLARWSTAVACAREAGPHFRLAAGELLCIDNYRMLHGRNGYVDPQRKLVSIWAWTTAAVAVPDGPLDIASPDLERLRSVG